MVVVIGRSKKPSKDDVSVSPFSVRRNFLIVALSVLIFLLAFQYLYVTWQKYNQDASREAIILGESLESLLHPEHISRLSGDISDTGKIDYLLTKASLTRLTDAGSRVRFAYLLAESDGQLVFLVDSEPVDSLDYSPPGQIYTEADEYCWQAFVTGKTVISEPGTDRWGTWISTLVPIKDPVDNGIIAVLGLDYDAAEWNLLIMHRMIPDFIIVIFIMVLFFILLRVWRQRSNLKKISARLKKSESLYRSVFNQAPIGVAIMSDTKFVAKSETGQTNINPEIERILGRTKDELEKIEWPDITHPNDLQADVEQFEQFKARNIESYIMEKRFRRPDGSYVWTNMKVSPLLDLIDASPKHLLLLEDISERKSIDKELRESERSKSILLSNLPGLAFRCKNDDDWTVLFVSEGCYELTGFTPESFFLNKDISLDRLAAPEYRQQIKNEWKRVSQEKKQFEYEYEIITATGERKWVLELSEGISGESGDYETIEGIILDISDRKAVEETLRYSSEHDRWTGLLNRTYLEGLLNHDTQISSTTGRSLGGDSATKAFINRAVIKVNLRAMQSLTATHGFHQTKELMRRVANELSSYCTNERMIFSTYEHRFVFYVKNYKDATELSDFCNGIMTTLSRVLVNERIGAGIGVLEIDPEDRSDADALLRNSLIASERAFAANNEGFSVCFYDKELQDVIVREEEIKQLLESIALGKDTTSLYLQFQPILELETNSIKGFEALARIKNDSLGLVSPVEFIPLVENTKLIIPIGDIITSKALSFLKRLEDVGYDDVSISINVSAIQMLSEDFCTNLFALIDDSGVNTSAVGIEITESAFASDFNEINSIIKELRDYGIFVAIDDFGVGYSSLARERELSINCLKIDKTFIDKILVFKRENTITSDIVSIAHKLGHCAVAEGVETEAQRQYLIDCGCDKIQGYLISRPLDEDVAIGFLKEYQESQDNSLLQLGELH